jgi:hypothetical protein
MYRINKNVCSLWKRGGNEGIKEELDQTNYINLYHEVVGISCSKHLLLQITMVFTNTSKKHIFFVLIQSVS